MAAPVLAPVIGALVLQVSSWRGTFAALTIIGAVILLATAAFLPETLPPDRRIDHRVRDDLRAYRRIAGATDFLPYLIVTSMFGGLLFTFISGAPFVVQDVYGHSATAFSLVFAFVSACMIAAGQVNARLVGSHAVVSLLRVGMIVSVAGSAALLVVSVAGRDVGLGLWVGALAIAVAPNGVVNPNATALAMEGYGANAGAAAALLGLAVFVLGAAAAPLVGVAGTATGIPMAVMMLVAASTGLMALCLLGRHGPT
jgi:DHA1 family bicyclomycin/chloramphenicol resistance-like MFS transporter